MKDSDKIETLSREPIKTGQGLIAYRKYLWALKFLQQKIDKIVKYKIDAISSIDMKIKTLGEQAQRLKDIIKNAMLADPSIDGTKTGGKSINLPDIGTVSVSKNRQTINVIDKGQAIEELGDDFIGIPPPQLDVIKVKKFLKDNLVKTPDGKVIRKDTGEVIDWININEDRTLTIKFRKYTLTDGIK